MWVVIETKILTSWTMISSVKLSQQNDLVILVKVNYHDIFPDQLSNSC